MSLSKRNLEILNDLRSMAAQGKLTGVYADIPNDVYHHPECPGVSSTQLKTIIKKSYKHYLQERGNSTSSKKFGTVFHSFVNEPEDFVNTYQIVKPKESVFIKPGMTALKDEDFRVVTEMSKKLFQHPDAAELLIGAANELTFFSIDSETGIIKKCRADAIKNMEVVSDLKTCQSASAEDFARDCRKYLYRVSAAYYLEVISEVLKKFLRDFYLIACEKEAPYEVAVYRVDNRSLLQGENEVRTALRILRKIKDEGDKAWTGLPLGISDLSI